MATSNEPVRQHWVPRVYLRNFASESTRSTATPKIHVLDLDSGAEFVSAIDKVFVKKNLYTLAKDSSEPNFVVERTLALIESYAAPHLRALSDGQPVHCKKGPRRMLAYFMATLLMRNQGIAARQAEGLKSMALDHAGWRPEHMRSDEYRKQAMVINNWYQSLDETGKHLFFLKSITDTAKIVAEELVGKSWTLFASHDLPYISSDNPVLLYHPNEERYGVATPGVTIQLTLSPKMMVMLGDGDVMNEAAIYPIPAEVVETINEHLAGNADRFIVSSVPVSAEKQAYMTTRK